MKVIKEVVLDQGSHTLKLDKIYPLASVEGNHIAQIRYLADHKPAVSVYSVVYADEIALDITAKDSIRVMLGKGYVVSIDPVWTKRFANRQGWAGGDGIYSFNLSTGNDQFDQHTPATNLFVFGDTLVGRTDKITKQRYEPLIMTNNSMAYFDKGQDQVHFHLNRGVKQSIESFFTLADRDNRKGTIPENLVQESERLKDLFWMSSFHPETVTITFDLNQKVDVTHIDVLNYWSQESPSLSSRGVKVLQLFGSQEGKKWDFIGEFQLKQSFSDEDISTIPVEKMYRYFKFDINPHPGIGNYEDDYEEGVFALKRVSFFHHARKYRDIRVEASSIMLDEPANAWIWLQDGVVSQNHLYFFPYTVVQDLQQPEGLQFAIKGISMIKVPITNERLIYQHQSQRPIPFHGLHHGSEYAFGGAVMAQTKQAGSINPDGYVYIYGYKTTIGLRQMLAARVKEEDIELFDRWEFYDGTEWVSDYLKAKPLLDHISTEFSVSRVLEGVYQDLYLVVFTFDTDTAQVAFALGETPVGPFTDPVIIYHTPEQAIFGKTTYTYNAKAHPQLSKSTDVLVTYNTNTYSFPHNMENAEVYNPRFLRFKDTSK
ncbi:MAG: DUF4185 domain-containing protein [Candidatus Izemoplasmatales bacterium]|jgi:hypothetical protein